MNIHQIRKNYLKLTYQSCTDIVYKSKNNTTIINDVFIRSRYAANKYYKIEYFYCKGEKLPTLVRIYNVKECAFEYYLNPDFKHLKRKEENK